MPDPITRDEFNMLRETVQMTGARIDEIDRDGTRGSGAVAVQMTEVIKDVADVRRDLADFRREHGEQHDAEQRSRVVTRRWLAGTIIAAFIALEGPIAFVVAHVH